MWEWTLTCRVLCRDTLKFFALWILLHLGKGKTLRKSFWIPAESLRTCSHSKTGSSYMAPSMNQAVLANFTCIVYTAIKMSSPYTWPGNLLALQSSCAHSDCFPMPTYNFLSQKGRQIQRTKRGPLIWEAKGCSWAQCYHSVPVVQPHHREPIGQMLGHPQCPRANLREN